VTEAFVQHYTHERPHQGRCCGNVPPRVAFPTLPTLPALPERVDPDAWLARLDQKVSLRHVGRAGCVDVDVATYSLGPQMAGCSVLLQVQAHSRQFAVWHQHQIVKLLASKGLLGQEMALDDYLQYILQEALAAPRRSSARRGRQSPTAASLGGGSLISSFSASFLRRLLSVEHVREHGCLCAGHRRGEPETICCMSSPCVCLPLHPPHTLLVSLHRLSFSRFSLSRFVEVTSSEVTMTESHTQRDHHISGEQREE